MIASWLISMQRGVRAGHRKKHRARTRSSEAPVMLGEPNKEVTTHRSHGVDLRCFARGELQVVRYLATQHLIKVKVEKADFNGVSGSNT